MHGVALLVFGLALLLVGAGASIMLVATGNRGRQDVQRGLAVVSGLRVTQDGPPSGEAASFGDRVVLPAVQRLASFGATLSPTGAGGRLQRRLDVAGNPRGLDVQQVLGAKVAVMLLIGTGGFWFGIGGGLLRGAGCTAVGAVAGFLLPDLLLYNAGAKRQQQVQNTMPDALDLLTISVEAGLGFDGALAQVARNIDGPLAGEFFRLLQEMQIGKSRSEAFQAMSARTEVPELRGFSSAIVQADALGIPVAGVLRQQAGEMRVKRMQRAEEKAMKVPVKILIPTVLLILPALFVVVLGPGVISIMNVFSTR